MVAQIPEWEVEDALAWKPKLLNIPHHLTDMKLIKRQKYLPELGRYIDLLFKSHDKFVLVEVKSVDITDDTVIHQQILPYKNALVHDLKIPPNQIIAVLAVAGNVSDTVRESFEKNGIIIRQIDSEQIVKTKPPNKFSLIEDKQLEKATDILKRRGTIINQNDLEDYGRKTAIYPEIKSVKTWLNEGAHDYLAKGNIATIFKDISASSPITAHEVGSNSDGELKNNTDMWFWLFYSVLDRRANATNFIRAREALEEENLFQPKQIMDFFKKKGESETLLTLAEILQKRSFPLLVDRSYSNLANPKSIVDAAKLISKYNYNFEKFYNSHHKQYDGDEKKILQSIWEDIKNNIYGAGERITAQFIRGMVLKGSWDLPLTNDRFLEKCGFNETFAGPLRLNLAENEEYGKDLGEFADEYLDGDRAIISHVLWYIRRRYCHRRPDCMHCKLSGYCRHYLKIQYKDMYTIKKSNCNANNINRKDNNQFQSTLKAFINDNYEDG